MKRTKLADRRLPGYTRGEEIFNMVTHIVGGGFGVLVLALCIVFSLLRRNYWGLAGGAVYGSMMVFLYTISSVYHGLKPEHAKKVLQVLDHCTIYALILGTYAPILLTGLRTAFPKRAIVIAVLILTMAAVGVTFTAIDFKRYAVIAMGGYFAIGWSLLFSVRPVLSAFGKTFLLWLIAGGAIYTLGMIFYGLGRKKRYFHSIFHLFILGGSVLQFVGIFRYCIL